MIRSQRADSPLVRSKCAVLTSILTLALIGVDALLPSRAEAQTCEDAFLSTSPNGLSSRGSLILEKAFEVDFRVNPVSYDPLVQRAVEKSLFHDFKMLTDMVPRELSAYEVRRLRRATEAVRVQKGEDQSIQHWILGRYKFETQLVASKDPLARPLWTLGPNSPHKATFDYIERTWDKLVRKTPEVTSSTLIPLRHSVLIPGARFQEGYYWDSYFAVRALIETGRAPLVRGQIENFLDLIDRFGFVPNGGRTYYLTRSQPPLLSRMIVEYLGSRGNRLSSSDLAWVKDRVFPLLLKDYQNFWMNPQTRFDAETGLNHHYDQLNTPRPERHAADKENELGQSYRDVRAEAESGKDFTVAFEGEATRVAPVLLNSVLYGVERDLALLARLIGQERMAQEYDRRSALRRGSMFRFMRDPETGVYYDFHLGRRSRTRVLTADAYAPIWIGVERGTPHTIQLLNSKLMRAGGIMGSEVVSGKQWDAPYTWAPHVFIAVEAMNSSGMRETATALSRSWIEMVDRVHGEKGVILEKYDAVRASSPIETGDKYVTQEGFLWSNGVYLTLLRHQLGVVPTRLQ